MEGALWSLGGLLLGLHVFLEGLDFLGYVGDLQNKIDHQINQYGSMGPWFCQSIPARLDSYLRQGCDRFLLRACQNVIDPANISDILLTRHELFL